jgi:hypothetical protein
MRAGVLQSGHGDGQTQTRAAADHVGDGDGLSDSRESPVLHATESIAAPTRPSSDSRAVRTLSSTSSTSATARRQDAPSRVWLRRGRTPTGAWRRQTRHLHLSRLHAHLRVDQKRGVYGPASNDATAVAGEAPGSHSGTERRLHDPLPVVGAYLGSVVRGHLQYYAVPLNLPAVKAFHAAVVRLWRRMLARRSHRGYVGWPRMLRLAARWLPPVRVCHPYPSVRFAVTTQGGSRMR